MISPMSRASKVYQAVAFRRRDEGDVLPEIAAQIEEDRRDLVEAACRVVPAQLRAEVRRAVLAA